MTTGVNRNDCVAWFIGNWLNLSGYHIQTLLSDLEERLDIILSFSVQTEVTTELANWVLGEFY